MMRALLAIPLMLILGGWASDKRVSEYRERHETERLIDKNLLDQQRLDEFWLNQQRQDREMRCQKRSIRYRCQELME